MELIILYFLINLVLLAVIWLATRPKGISIIGYFLVMIFLGLPILVVFIVLFIVALLGSATYNLGQLIESWF